MLYVYQKPLFVHAKVGYLVCGLIEGSSLQLVVT